MVLSRTSAPSLVQGEGASAPFPISRGGSMVPLRLIKPYGHNNQGEVAGFPEDTASRLIQAGIAIPYTDNQPPEEAPPRMDKQEHSVKRRPRRRSTTAAANGN